VDWDIKNSMFTLMTQLVARMGMALDIPDVRLPSWTAYAQDPDSWRRRVTAMGNGSGKEVLIKVAHGGAVPLVPDGGVQNLLNGISREARLLRWYAASVMPTLFSALLEQPEKYSWPENTAMHYLWTTVENQCLLAWATWLRREECPHLSLHFDGLLVSSERCQDRDQFAKDSMHAISSTTGYEVEILVKEHQTLFEAISQAASRTGRVGGHGDSLDVLCRPGNCIPLGLAHLSGEYGVLADKAKVVKLANTGGRKYADWSEALVGPSRVAKRRLVPAYGLDVDNVGLALVHSEGRRTPHCIAVRVMEGGQVEVCERDMVYYLTKEELIRCYESCDDRSTVVTFHWMAATSSGYSAPLLELTAAQVPAHGKM
jgi:hypothetical protein